MVHSHSRYPLSFVLRAKLVIVYQANSDTRRETTGCSGCPIMDRELSCIKAMAIMRL